MLPAPYFFSSTQTHVSEETAFSAWNEEDAGTDIA